MLRLHGVRCRIIVIHHQICYFPYNRIQRRGGGKCVRLASKYFGAKISIKPETVQSLVDRFGQKPLEDFLYEFNIAGSVEALTEKEGRYILRQSSLDALRNRILEAAQERNIPPSAWELQTSFQRLAGSQAPVSGTAAADLKAILSPKIANFRNAPQVEYVQSEAYLPNVIQNDIKAKNASGEVVAVWHRGRIHFVADNIRSSQ